MVSGEELALYLLQGAKRPIKDPDSVDQFDDE